MRMVNEDNTKSSDIFEDGNEDKIPVNSEIFE